MKTFGLTANCLTCLLKADEMTAVELSSIFTGIEGRRCLRATLIFKEEDMQQSPGPHPNCISIFGSTISQKPKKNQVLYMEDSDLIITGLDSSKNVGVNTVLDSNGLYISIHDHYVLNQSYFFLNFPN